MKVKCKICQYEREHLGEYEDYQCPICNSILYNDKQGVLLFQNNCSMPEGEYQIIFTPLENETVGLDEVIKLHIIASFKRDIQKMGKDRVWKTIEHLTPAKVRMRYRKFYFLAIEELKEEV